MLSSFKNLLLSPAQKPAVQAYDIWSESYDFQPGNLMLDLDEQLLTALSENIDLEGRVLADIGCGTGRHWPRLYAKKPLRVFGFDVSSGMLKQLRQKFPQAIAHRTSNDLLDILPDGSVDFLLSTLTMAHIQNPRLAIHSWSRVLKSGGLAIVTDFHPDLLEKGGRRSFSHAGKTVSVVNHIYPLNWLKEIFHRSGFQLLKQEEKRMDESVKHYYETQGAIPVYERFKGTPIIYGLLLKKQRVTE